MDADITGPSIPKAFGLSGMLHATEDNRFIPAKTESGISVVSINLLLPDEEEPVIWRGPIIAGVVQQFWSEAEWGMLDVLLIDMPPGTGDVPLTVFQSVPVDGIVLVSTPQDLVSMIVAKAVTMMHLRKLSASQESSLSTACLLIPLRLHWLTAVRWRVPATEFSIRQLRSSWGCKNERSLLRTYSSVL